MRAGERQRREGAGNETKVILKNKKANKMNEPCERQSGDANPCLVVYTVIFQKTMRRLRYRVISRS